MQLARVMVAWGTCAGYQLESNLTLEKALFLQCCSFTAGLGVVNRQTCMDVHAELLKRLQSTSRLLLKLQETFFLVW